MRVAQPLTEKNIVAQHIATMLETNAILTASTNRSVNVITKATAAISLWLFACTSNATICNYEIKTENGDHATNEAQGILIKSHIDNLEIQMVRLQIAYLSDKTDSTVNKIIDLHQEKLACLSDKRKVNIR